MKSRQQSAPLASSTGATETRIQDLTRLTQSQHWPTVSVGKLKAVNGVPLSPQAQVQPKHGSRILAVSWQFDHAEACGPRSLAYSPHAKPALTHCLCRQVKSRQWSAPPASSTGATEARLHDVGSQLAVRSCRGMWSSLTGLLASRKASTGPLSLSAS